MWLYTGRLQLTSWVFEVGVKSDVIKTVNCCLIFAHVTVHVVIYLVDIHAGLESNTLKSI